MYWTTVYQHSTDILPAVINKEDVKLVAQQFFEGAVLNNVLNLLKVGVNFNLVPMTGFKKEGMRSCTGENCVAKILG